MKKILTVSLFAVMAVSAAHAKIASVEYVEGASVLGLTEGQTVQTELKNAVVPAVKALQTKVDQISEGTGLTLGADAVNTGNIVDGAVALVDLNKDVKDSIADAKKAGTDASTALTAHMETAESTYETKQDASGKLTAAKDYTDLAAKADANGDLGSGFVKKYVDEKIGVLQGNTGLGGIQTTLGQQQQEITGLGEALEAEADRAQAAEQANAEAIAGLADGAVKDNADAIAAINDDTTGILAQAKADAAAKIADLDVTKTTADNGKYFSAYEEVDGKISMEQKAFETAIVADEKNAPTTGAVHTAVEGAKTYTDTAITNLTASESMPAECKAEGARCALIAVGGALQWEPVEY